MKNRQFNVSAMTTMTISAGDAQLTELAKRVAEHLLASQRRLVAAESCTGGWIGKVLTDVAGSSAWFLGGAVVYSNRLKSAMLGVAAATLAREGAVSEAVVREMAEGALARLGGELSVAVTGIAGPDGGTVDKPVGTVWFAWSRFADGAVDTVAERLVLAGDREQIRRQTVAHALARISQL